MKKIITILFICLGTIFTNAQSNLINYQGVARDGSGNIMQNQNITIKLDIKFDTETATPSYTETHNITTDANGVFSLQIGNGSVDFGVYNELNWDSQKAFITTSIDGTEVGTTEMHAVPFALNAGGSGLEALDEGNGVGWRLKGSNPDNYGNIGFQSVDLSYQHLNSSEKGATSFYSFATGSRTEASGFTSTAMGSNSFASGNYSFAVGNTPVASGNASFATGINSFAQSIAETTIGSYNEIYTPSPGGANNWDENDRLFTIGNGPTFDNRSNAFIVLKNGTITAPSFDISEITDNKALITKEYLENNTASKIDDLIDGKHNESSLFLGNEAGLNDDGTFNINTGIGFGTLKANTTGYANTALGWGALLSNTSGYNNIALGSASLGSNTNGANNTAVGASAMQNSISGENNTALGSYSLFKNEENDNTAVGMNTLRENRTGVFNTALGSDAMKSNTIGSVNTAIGASALFANTTGSSNTAVGIGALGANTTGIENTALGAISLSSNTVGNYNVAIGYKSLEKNTNGRNNTAIGFHSLNLNSVGSSNVSIGYESLANNFSGDRNVAIGSNALTSNTTGICNTSLGWLSLENNTSGNGNVAVGCHALKNVTTGKNNIGIGDDTTIPVATNSNQVRIGNTFIGYAGIQVAWTVTSDKRWKDSIRQLPYGLNMIQKLKPVDYIRKNNDKKTREIGFIAQDVEKVLNDLNYDDQGFLTKDDKGYLSLRYNDLIPVLTKAVQEQQLIIEKLQKTNETQQSSLKEQNEKYQALLSKVEVIEKKLLINATTYNK